MSFANLSGLGVVLGVAGLAAALFLLQRLRVRYQPKRVVTIEPSCHDQRLFKKSDDSILDRISQR